MQVGPKEHHCAVSPLEREKAKLMVYPSTIIKLENCLRCMPEILTPGEA